jgi:alcohol dehydrogenase class IV
MQDTYMLNYPGRIIFGTNMLAALPELLPSKTKKVLLATGNHAAKNGLLDELKSHLKDFEIVPVSGITPEPPLEEVDKLLELGRREEVDAVVAVGGGSVIDSAKAAACLIPKPGSTADYFYGRKEITEKGLFFAALPTTAGPGAEITKNSVLTDQEARIKKSIRHPTMVPDIAIIDPLLTVSASPALTAASGLDAYTQAVESYISLNANETTKALAIKAVKLIYDNLPAACETPNEIEPRKGMAEGSMISAMAFSQSGLGAVHGLAHPTGSLLKIPHGVTCAVLLPYILKWNQPACQKEYAELAAVCGANSADEFIANTASLCSRLGIPEGFKRNGLEEKHFEFILNNCRSNSMTTNPRQMEDSDIISLLNKLTEK